MASLNSVYGGMLSGLASSIYILVWVIPLILIISFIVVHFRNKKIYVYPVRIFRTRENGKVIEKNFKGGYIKRRGSSPYFRIKLGKWWWQYTDLITTPNPEYMDEQNRVYLKQIDVGSFVQMRRYFDNRNNVYYSPVESDVKYGAILSIQRIRQLTSTEPTWKKLATIGGMVLVFAMGIVGWALMMNAKCPTLG
ncbi:MAG: hypothetical protein ACTSPV_01210 [Candidatus Hodarchaeales archaeon]